jgi:hypothetical protein
VVLFLQQRAQLARYIFLHDARLIRRVEARIPGRAAAELGGAIPLSHPLTLDLVGSVQIPLSAGSAQPRGIKGTLGRMRHG